MKKKLFRELFQGCWSFFNTRRLLFVILITVEILSTVYFLKYSEIYRTNVGKRVFLKTRVNFGHFEEVRFESAKYKTTEKDAKRLLQEEVKGLKFCTATGTLGAL